MWNLSDVEPDDILAELLIQWEEAWERGEDILVERLCLDHPELIGPVQDRIAALKQMAWMTKQDDGDPIHVPDELIGNTLGNRYRIESLISEGGFGRVYRAFDPELQRHVAVKVPKSHRIAQNDHFLEEARKAAKLKHPNIVTIHDVGREDGVVFIVADLIEGNSLDQLIESNRPSHKEAARIVAEIADALQTAHNHGFLHRDIKPANILLDKQGHAHVADFGIASAVEHISQAEMPSGTLAYMAPEQLGDESHLIGTRTDIHALGVVFYELLTGKLPFDCESPNILRDSIRFRPPHPMTSTNCSIPDHLQRICLRCLSKHPSDRFGSMAEFATALRSATSERKPDRRIGLIVVSLTFVMVGVMVWFASGLTNRQTHPSKPETKSPVVLEPVIGTFEFDGKTRIVTPLLSFSPCTIEAWFRKTDDRREQFIIGSDVPHNHGLGIGVNNNCPIVEVIHGGFNAEMPVTPGEWVHMAAVYGADETKLFVDGKKVGVGAATLSPPIESHFVIGNVGEDHSVMFFRGQIRCVRISRGERYLKDFEPESLFKPDAADAPHRAVLIFDGSKVERDRVIDLSGEENDGTWNTAIR